MGGELSAAAKGSKPGFLIQALKDPDGANLDRVQVVKGWLDERGNTHEQVYDVALSDGRTQNSKTGKAPAVENTITAAGNTYTNASGAVNLASFWQDPEFKADQRAFYYVRVIEIPTPRWTAYDASYFDQPDNDEIPMQTQERVYSSPIWYNP